MSEQKQPSNAPSTGIPSAEEFKARLLGIGGAAPPSETDEIPAELDPKEVKPAAGAVLPVSVSVSDAHLANQIEKSGHIRPDLDELIRQVVEVDRVVGGGRGPRSWLKRAIVMICRPFTRRQATYNALLLAALAESNERHAAIHAQLHNFSEMIAKDQADMLNNLERIETLLREINGGLVAQGDHLHGLSQGLETHRHDLTAALFQEMSRQLREEVTPAMAATIRENKQILTNALKSLVAEEAGALRAIVKSAQERVTTKAQAGKDDDSAEQGNDSVVLPPDSPFPGADLQKMREALSYFHFEHFSRGTPDQINERQAGYIDLFRERLGGTLKGKAILDLGAGSGLLAGALQVAGATAEAIDSNMAAVGAGQEAGRPVREADIFQDLAARKDASLDAITCFQVVEHLPGHLLAELYSQALRVLKPGGFFLAETLNPRSFAAFRWYFMDLSHIHFLQPETLEHIAREEGFSEVEIKEISLPPDYQRLTVPDDVTSEMRANLEMINKTLFGPQEYYLIAEKRTE